MAMIESIVESFTNNPIVEDRYRMILDGLQVTLLMLMYYVVMSPITLSVITNTLFDLTTSSTNELMNIEKR